MVKIVQKENAILRKKAREIPLAEIKSAKIKKIIGDMEEALESQDDGVAIAAPQIGQLLKIFVVSGKIFLKKEETDENSAEQKTERAEKIPNLVFINPVIKKQSREKAIVEEGCLSVRYAYGKIKRSKKVLLEAYDENGNKISRGATGLLAQIFQHETDHLNGVLFIDSAKDIREIPPKNQSNEQGK
jgi:peptide deformylase